MTEECDFSNQYVLWYHDVLNSSWDKDSYRNLCTGLPNKAITNACELWGVYRSLDDNFVAGMFFLMKKGIFPQWEDPANQKGGYWSFKVSKRMANKVWAELSASFCGNTLTKNAEMMKEITGISCSPKISNCVMKIWNRDAKYSNVSLLTNEVKGMESDQIRYRKHK